MQANREDSLSVSHWENKALLHTRTAHLKVPQQEISFGKKRDAGERTAVENNRFYGVVRGYRLKGGGAKEQQVGAFADFNGAEIPGESEGHGVCRGWRHARYPRVAHRLRTSVRVLSAHGDPADFRCLHRRTECRSRTRASKYSGHPSLRTSEKGFAFSQENGPCNVAMPTHALPSRRLKHDTLHDGVLPVGPARTLFAFCPVQWKPDDRSRRT